jgi:hypothetical protein
MGQYYRRHEFGIRFACFFVCALLSNACSSVRPGSPILREVTNHLQFLAYAIGHMDGVHGVKAWRWYAPYYGLR